MGGAAVNDVVELEHHRLVTPDGQLIHEALLPSHLHVWPPYVKEANGTVYVRGEVQWWTGPWRYEVLDRATGGWWLVAEGTGDAP